jgi:nucleoside-diphosphate-sugar epimerase
MTLNEIFEQIRDIISEANPEVAEIKPIFEEERVGDVRHSLADISLAKEYLNYEPAIDSRKGLSLTVQSHI